MRGKVQLRNGKQTSRGITPAYAGKRWTVAGTVAARWDHPRVCGEKASLMLASDAELGSPPRMRGKVREIKTGKSRRGITPAYAGKRHGEAQKQNYSKDHPRVCGEKLDAKLAPRLMMGSPPRMRGKALKTSWDRTTAGITPAYAGKSTFQLCWCTASWDHPRVCGEKYPPVYPFLPGFGITPAYAGKRTI